jgi:hypothetical protein
MESHESMSIKSLVDAFHLPFVGIWLLPYFVQHIMDFGMEPHRHHQNLV